MTIEPRDPATAAANEPDNAFGIDSRETCKRHGAQPEGALAALYRSRRSAGHPWDDSRGGSSIRRHRSNRLYRLALVLHRSYAGGHSYQRNPRAGLLVIAFACGPHCDPSASCSAWYPLQGAITLTMLLTAYFLAHGIMTFIFAFSIKQETGRWVLFALERFGRPPARGVCHRGMAVNRSFGCLGFSSASIWC